MTKQKDNYDEIDENPLIIDGVKLSDYTGTRKPTLDELLPDVGDNKKMPLAEAWSEGYDILPKVEEFKSIVDILPDLEGEVELTDEERYINATKVKLPELDRLPKLTENDLEDLDVGKGLNLTDDDLSDLDDNSPKLPKPPTFI